LPSLALASPENRFTGEHDGRLAEWRKNVFAAAMIISDDFSVLAKLRKAADFGEMPGESQRLIFAEFMLKSVAIAGSIHFPTPKFRI
jgi:hypothetical protein